MTSGKTLPFPPVAFLWDSRAERVVLQMGMTLTLSHFGLPISLNEESFTPRSMRIMSMPSSRTTCSQSSASTSPRLMPVVASTVKRFLLQRLGNMSDEMMSATSCGSRGIFPGPLRSTFTSGSPEAGFSGMIPSPYA